MPAPTQIKAQQQIKELRKQIRALQRQLSRVEAKNAKLLIIEAQSKEQTKTIIRLRQQLNDAKVDRRVRANLVREKPKFSKCRMLKISKSREKGLQMTSNGNKSH